MVNEEHKADLLCLTPEAFHFTALMNGFFPFFFQLCTTYVPCTPVYSHHYNL